MNEIKGPLRIGELLVQKGVVSADQVRIALIEQTIKVAELADLQQRVAELERRLAGEGLQ